MRHKPVIVVALIMLLLVILSAYLITRNRNNVDYYLQADDCQIEKTSCQITLDQRSTIKVNILPRGIPNTEKLTISVDTIGDSESLDGAGVFFEAIEIDTITPQYRLYKKAKSSFIGNGFLAVCSLSKQSWITHLIVKKDGKTWEVSLPFKKQLTN